MKLSSILLPLAASLLIAAQSSAADLITHVGTNFSIQLPSDFVRQPQKSYDDAFRFQADGKGQPISFWLVGVVGSALPLQTMSSVQVVEVLFQANPDYPQHYSDFVAQNEPDGTIRFWTSDSKSLYWPSFRVTDRRILSTGKIEKAELMLYETGWMREPMLHVIQKQETAFVIDTGVRKYVFRVFPRPDNKSLQDLTAAVATFTETAEPGGAANGTQPIRSDTNSTSSAARSRR